MPVIKLGEVRLGDIGNPSPTSGNFTKIQTWDGVAIKTLWQNGVSTPVEVVVSRSWELHCYYVGYCPDGWFNMTVSYNGTNLPVPKQSLGERYILATVPENVKSFNMGIMPNAAITLNVKLWTSEYYTTDKPPSDQW